MPCFLVNHYNKDPTAKLDGVISSTPVSCLPSLGMCPSGVHATLDSPSRSWKWKQQNFYGIKISFNYCLRIWIIHIFMNIPYKLMELAFDKCGILSNNSQAFLFASIVHLVHFRQNTLKCLEKKHKDFKSVFIVKALQPQKDRQKFSCF